MKLLQLLALVVFIFAAVALPAALAQEGKPSAAPPAFQKDKYPPPDNPVFSGASLGAGLGMGLTIIGAGWGMGRIGSAAVESMARQPEVAGQIQTAMIIIAAMLEGATLASVILSYLVGAGATF